MKLTKLRVEQFADVRSGGTPATATGSYWDGGVPWITPKDLAGYEARYIAAGERDISEEGLNNSSATLLPVDTVLLSTRAPVGYVALAAVPLATNQGFKNLVCRSGIAVPKFVYYLLKQNTELLESHATGATFKELSGSRLKAIEFTLPELAVQTRIAELLSAYDDLFENNRRRIALLEEAGRQLYREWFVRLRFPGHEHTRITNGVPEGWVRKPLGALADFRLGKMLDEKTNKGDLMPYLANVNVRWGSIDLANLREMRFEENELDTFGLRHGDIVMCEGGEPGRCALWKDQLPGMMIQKAIHRIRAHPEVSYVFLYYSLRHKGASGEMATLFTGATIKHLPREKLALVQFVIPPARLMALFAEQVDALEKQIGLLEATNRRASHARNLLLPRLMSGEIAV